MRLATHYGLVFFDNELLSLPPKERGALCLLLRFCPDPVPKDRFADEVWGGSEMSDESLARCISQLRRLLPMDADVTIRPIYGFGYQLQAAPTSINTEKVARHARLADAANGNPEWTESLLHARGLMDYRDVSAVERAKEILRDLIAIAPRYMPARLLLIENLALYVYWNSDPNGELLAEAEHHLGIVSKLAPQTPGLAAIAGHLCDISCDFSEAAKLHAQAMHDDPNDPNTHYLFGVHLDLIGRPRAAANAIRKAVQLRPYSINFQVMLARQEYTAGDFVAARTTSLQVRKQAEKDLTFRSVLHSLDVFMDAESEGAEQAYDSVPTTYIFGRSHLGYLFAKRGDREKAIEVIRRAGSSHPGIAATFVPVLLELGFIDEAIDRAELALKKRVGFLPGLLRKPENRRLTIHPRFAKLQQDAFRGNS
ncbi:MAG: winged helix-turn-helix domain-containing protein [Bradyrhizobium sp.]